MTQNEIWLQMYAAALAGGLAGDSESVGSIGATKAAARADVALAEYNKRFDILAKHENVVADLSIQRERDKKQITTAITTLIRVQSNLEVMMSKTTTCMRISGSSGLRSRIEESVSEIRETMQEIDRVLFLDDEGKRYVLVPIGDPPPKPQKGST